MTVDRERELATRRIHIGASVKGVMVGDHILAPRSVLSVGAEGSGADIELPGWTDERFVVISGDPSPLLHLRPGMRVHMCHDEGEDRLVGTFEELVRRGVPIPVPIRVSKLNIGVAEGTSLFVHYLAEGESAERPPQEPAP